VDVGLPLAATGADNLDGNAIESVVSEAFIATSLLVERRILNGSVIGAL